MPPLKVFWQPSGTTFDSIGTKRYVRHSDGDTPTISTAIRMLSIDTPELHYPENSKPSRHDGKLAELAGWLREGRAPADPELAAYLAPRLAAGDAGTRQERQGRQASDAFQALLDTRLQRADGTLRPLFVRTADRPFDDYGRLLAYIAPQYSPAELRTRTLEDRATFNLLMVEAGWAAPFLIFPDLPGQPDLKLFHRAANTAVTEGRGIWGDPFVLTGYEFRMAYQLWEVTAKLVGGEAVASSERTGWITRWCADMTTGLLHEPQAYFRVRPQDRLFIRPQDVREAVASLNLTPA